VSISDSQVTDSTEGIELDTAGRLVNSPRKLEREAALAARKKAKLECEVLLKLTGDEFVDQVPEDLDNIESAQLRQIIHKLRADAVERKDQFKKANTYFQEFRKSSDQLVAAAAVGHRELLVVDAECQVLETEVVKLKSQLEFSQGDLGRAQKSAKEYKLLYNDLDARYQKSVSLYVAPMSSSEDAARKFGREQAFADGLTLRADLQGLRDQISTQRQVARQCVVQEERAKFQGLISRQALAAAMQQVRASDRTIDFRAGFASFSAKKDAKDLLSYKVGFDAGVKSNVDTKLAEAAGFQRAVNLWSRVCDPKLQVEVGAALMQQATELGHMLRPYPGTPDEMQNWPLQFKNSHKPESPYCISSRDGLSSDHQLVKFYYKKFWVVHDG
jgi:hypothetical protein